MSYIHMSFVVHECLVYQYYQYIFAVCTICAKAIVLISSLTLCVQISEWVKTRTPSYLLVHEYSTPLRKTVDESYVLTFASPVSIYVYVHSFKVRWTEWCSSRIDSEKKVDPLSVKSGQFLLCRQKLHISRKPRKKGKVHKAHIICLCTYCQKIID